MGLARLLKMAGKGTPPHHPLPDFKKAAKAFAELLLFGLVRGRPPLENSKRNPNRYPTGGAGARLPQKLGACFPE